MIRECVIRIHRDGGDIRCVQMTQRSNQLCAFVVGGVATNGYDAAGDVVYDGRSSYLYDPDGHVCAVSTPSYTGGVEMIQYIYDASGSRVAKGKILAWSCDQTTNGFAITN